MIQGEVHKNENKEQVLISVAVSCKGILKILEKNLLALSRQNLSRELWSAVFVFKEGSKNSECISLIKEHFPVHKFLFLPREKPLYEMRNLVFDYVCSDYIYFIDEDVILDDSHHLSRLIEIHKKFPEMTVIGGSYLDHPDCSFWGRSYNWIARLWIKHQTSLVPAGNLSIKMIKAFKSRFYSPGKFGFGGEEIHLISSLQKEGHTSIWKEELSASHLATHGLIDFIKRAWFHGVSLALEKRKKKLSYVLFLKEPALFLIKISALFYLLLVRFSCLFYKIFRKR